MKVFTLPPDDRATILTPLDRTLLLTLEETASDHFYLGCDRVIQSLLNHCQWVLTTNLKVPTLTLACPDTATYWTLVSYVEVIGEHLSRVTRNSRVEIISREKGNIYFDIKQEA